MSRCRRCRVESTWICVTCHSRLRTGADGFGILAPSNREVDPCGTSFGETPGHTQLEKGRRSPSASSRLRITNLYMLMSGIRGRFRRDRTASVSVERTHVCSFSCEDQSPRFGQAFRTSSTNHPRVSGERSTTHMPSTFTSMTFSVRTQ